MSIFKKMFSGTEEEQEEAKSQFVEKFMEGAVGESNAAKFISTKHRDGGLVPNTGVVTRSEDAKAPFNTPTSSSTEERECLLENQELVKEITAIRTAYDILKRKKSKLESENKKLIAKNENLTNILNNSGVQKSTRRVRLPRRAK